MAKSARITVLAAGSRGDVQPYLALAVGLMKEGYEVKFAANINFAGLAQSHGLKFFPIQVDSYAFVKTQSGRSWLESDSTVKLIFNTARAIKLENAPKNMPVPLHPGAERYYREKGLM